ncbi:hypothetical protein ACFL2Q_17360, partial [Thermodesulfobacteriota bacterium]
MKRGIIKNTFAEELLSSFVFRYAGRRPNTGDHGRKGTAHDENDRDSHTLTFSQREREPEGTAPQRSAFM